MSSFITHHTNYSFTFTGINKIKLQPLRDRQRNEKLAEAMKKFRTKDYWNNSSNASCINK